MRKLTLLPAVSAMLLYGCDTFAPLSTAHLPLNSLRHESVTIRDEPADPWGHMPFRSADSTLCLSVLHADSLGKKILIYRNWKVTHEIPITYAGIVPEDGDMHHMYGEHLYTELPSGPCTTVCCDGRYVATLGSGEYLIGICRSGSDLYLLSTSGPGTGFRLRKNGSVIMSRYAGNVLGDLQDTSYMPGGALYEDNGLCVFAWLENAVHGHILGAGIDEEFHASDYLMDARMHGGRIFKTLKHFDGKTWHGARLWFEDGKAMVIGESSEGTSMSIRSSSCEQVDESTGAAYEHLDITDAMLYHNPSHGLTALHTVDGGLIGIYGRNGPFILSGEYEKLTPSCVGICGDGPVAGLNPSGTGRHPRLYFKGRIWELDWIDGRITSLCVGVSPPS